MQHPLIVIAVAATLVASAAASWGQGSRPASQPVAATGEFVWHDLVTHDPAASRAFYGALFGWTFEDGEGVDPGYTIIKQEGVPIGGVVTQRRTAEPVVAQWLTYVVVADVDRALDTFQRAGGRVVRGPLNARKDLRVAVVADPQGAPIGLASRGPKHEGPAPSAPPAVHQWLWMEYLAMDPAAALAFYREAVGFGHEISETRDNFTYYLLTTDRPRAGLFRPPWTRETSAWLPYVRVVDPQAMAARVVALGGTVALPPAPGVRNGSLAIVLDPTGAPLALQKYPFASGGAP
jgi:predicted enzyme related to lactoylglutathione lyase